MVNKSSPKSSPILTQEAMPQINNDMPSEARYGEVFQAIRDAQAKKIVEWLKDLCDNPRHSTPFREQPKGKRRYECPLCLEELERMVRE